MISSLLRRLGLTSPQANLQTHEARPTRDNCPRCNERAARCASGHRLRGSAQRTTTVFCQEAASNDRVPGSTINHHQIFLALPHCSPQRLKHLSVSRISFERRWSRTHMCPCIRRGCAITAAARQGRKGAGNAHGRGEGARPRDSKRKVGEGMPSRCRRNIARRSARSRLTG